MRSRRSSDTPPPRGGLPEGGLVILLQGRADTVCGVTESDLTERLQESIDELANMLRRYGESHWSEWLPAAAERIEQGDAGALDQLLRSFGGMGSLNDIVLSQRDGSDLRAEEWQAVNLGLRELLELVYERASALRGAGL